MTARKPGTGCLTMVILFALGAIASGVVAARHYPFWAIGVAWAPFAVLMIIAIFTLPPKRK